MFVSQQEEDDEKAGGERTEESDKEKRENSDQIELYVLYGKNKYDIRVSVNQPVIELKKKVESLTGVPTSMQKLVAKNALQDGMILRQCNLVNGQKVMLIGSKPLDVISVNTKPSQQELKREAAKANRREPWCRQKQHMKILEKGVPNGVMSGIKNAKDPLLPSFPITGMLNKTGGKVQLSFKLELDQVWIGSEASTQKIQMNQVQDVLSEPIDGHEEYHIMALQLGSSEQSRCYFYWVPAQYVDAIKNIILG